MHVRTGTYGVTLLSVFQLYSLEFDEHKII